MKITNVLEAFNPLFDGLGDTKAEVKAKYLNGNTFEVSLFYQSDNIDALELSHRFVLDLTQIEMLLKEKNADIGLAKPGSIVFFLETSYYKIIPLIFFLQGKGKYNQLVDIIIARRGATTGKAFGL